MENPLMNSETKTVEKEKRKIKNLKKNTINNKRSQKKTKISRLKYEQKIVQIKRVTKVVKGGKKMTFRAIVIIGNSKRKVGVGVGRADDINLAIEKAIIHGKKNLINVPVTIKYSIPHIINASYGASSILLRPASQGTGVIAGGAVRAVLELAGLKNIVGKQFGSKNLLNNAKATILALSLLNEKILLGKAQGIRNLTFYQKIMRKYKNEKVFT